ncbi:MAG: hypothetical protein ACXU7G_12415, partial [Croceibacterium sp.]
MAESLQAALMAATMARQAPKGNRHAGLFPRLLWGLSGVIWFRHGGTRESALQQRFDPLVELLEGGFALDL